MSQIDAVTGRRRWRWIVALLVAPILLIGVAVVGWTYYYDSVESIVPDRQPAGDRAMSAQLPETARRAFVAAIEPGFLEHSPGGFAGVDPAELTRGYVRLATQDDDGGLRETIIAAKLEAEYSLEEILLLYLDRADFGSGRIGVQAAALGVFRHDAAKLTLAEAAALGAMLNGTPRAERQIRWAEILREMLDRDWISQAQLAKLTFPSAASSA
ncbi:membrane peptidoglycan carboxypeptidase [Allocatelliglobosispora scoriae]|uniref:Membrane peptidoglycan carboxypeptidase n=1 Tax=Allocatelliglobosispora scoriae TaxID=643052 RepID=A0A841BNC4_9ACTN|nr:transglycosylase domain-containing protein [Allocatelliglobosispora scoriae]MBB5869175.1 membrane peptidoglycan carboxypeptidase [Allocatelliglobosispora scoriae]